MSTTFTRTREQIGAMVLRKLGVLASGETADANDLSIIYEALDLRLKELHTIGLQFWKRTAAQTAITLTSSTTAFALPSDFILAHSFSIVDSDSEIPLEFISHTDYERITDKGAFGTPQKVHIDYASSNFYLWPVPNTQTTSKLTYEKKADDTATSTAPDVPVEMMRALSDMVAYDVSQAFGIKDATLAQMALIAEKNISVYMALRMQDSKVRVEYF